MRLTPASRREVEQVSAGSFLFADWARENMRREDLMQVEQVEFTGYIVGSGGRRVCVDGKVVRLGDKTLGLTWGILQVGPQNNEHVLFLDATASPAKKGSTVSFCGVVTEGYKFKNERGYSRTGVVAVGMIGPSDTGQSLR